MLFLTGGAHIHMWSMTYADTGVAEFKEKNSILITLKLSIICNMALKDTQSELNKFYRLKSVFIVQFCSFPMCHGEKNNHRRKINNQRNK